MGSLRRYLVIAALMFFRLATAEMERLNLRRYLVIAALMFWLGGFTFYVSVVVPIGTDVFGSPLLQGMVTRRVTVWLNVAGAVAQIVLLWDVLATADASAWRFWGRVGLWLFIACCQGGLFGLHAYLDSMIDVEAMHVSHRRAFYQAHRVYLWTHTLQWLAGLLFIALTLSAWRAEDSKQKAGERVTSNKLS